MEVLVKVVQKFKYKIQRRNATKTTVGFVHNDLDVQDLISGYNINGSNHYKLRDLCDVRELSPIFFDR